MGLDDSPQSPSTSLPGNKTNKSCDECRSRKVRCPDPSSRGPCKNCVRRKTKCNFAKRKPSHRRNVAAQFLPKIQTPSPDGHRSAVTAGERYSDTAHLQDPSPQPQVSQLPFTDTPCGSNSSEPVTIHARHVPDLFVDHLLSRAQNPNVPGIQEQPGGRGNGILGSYRITFFSDGRLASLANLLGNNQVNELVGRISGVINSRVGNRPNQDQRPAFPCPENDQATPLFSDKALAARYIELYFERVNPIFPFLDRNTFERNSTRNGKTDVNKSWLCLYHTILALGCQYDDGGSFEPGAGKSWRLFAVALEAFPDLLLQPDSIETLQAMAAMAVYSLGVSCMALEHVIISEAARRAQNLAGASFTGPAALAYQRAFWVLYAIEKLASFHMGRSSVFIDGDIACPIPHIPESAIDGIDWLITLLRYARIVSKALASLFCIGVSNKPSTYHLDVARQLTAELEVWRLSLPDNGLRPGGKTRPEVFHGPVQRCRAVLIHYLHSNMSLVMSLTTLHHSQKGHGDVKSQRQEAAATILDTSRKILEMTTLVDIEPQTNVWVLAIIPVTALFVLFDIVVHNPWQPEASSNLALLDVAAGHFSHLEYRSRGTLPGSLISEFAHIARNYLNHVQKGARHRQQEGGIGPSLSSAIVLPNTCQQVSVQQSVGMGMTGDARVTGLSMPTHSDQVQEFGWLADGFESHLAGDGAMGTDILDLFSTMLPDLGPMFYQEP